MHLNLADLPTFYVIGRCSKGSRHYSKGMSYEDALAIMPKYISVVDYFGGGTVDLVNWDGVVLKHKKV